MTFNEKWANHLKNAIPNDTEYVIRSYSDQWNQSRIRSQLILINKKLSVEETIHMRYNNVKMKLSKAAQLAEYCFKVYNNNWPYWNMKPYSYALLSDNKALIERYAHLPVDEHIIYENPKDGVPKGFNYAFQGLLRDDLQLIERGMNSFKNDIDKRKSIGFHNAHIMCTEAIVSKDSSAIKKALQNFEKGRLKNEMIKADICENVISFFPIAYAKIAWLKGIEVDPESKYMPLELLKIKPLDEYTIPYWFLRDFYREQGIDWRYDPIHPELQDWGNDPENPDRKKGGFFKTLFG